MKAVILVAGKGTRLRPLTDNTPKPMLNVGGRPLLEWMIMRVKEAGIDDVLLVTNYLENKFIDYMGAGKPILGAMGGEQAEIIKKYETGRVVPAFDDEGLALLVVETAENFAPYEEMGRRGSQLVKDQLLLPNILSRYADAVERVAAGETNEIQAWEPL